MDIGLYNAVLLLVLALTAINIGKKHLQMENMMYVILHLNAVAVLVVIHCKVIKF